MIYLFIHITKFVIFFFFYIRFSIIKVLVVVVIRLKIISPKINNNIGRQCGEARCQIMKQNRKRRGKKIFNALKEVSFSIYYFGNLFTHVEVMQMSSLRHNKHHQVHHQLPSLYSLMSMLMPDSLQQCDVTIHCCCESRKKQESQRQQLVIELRAEILQISTITTTPHSVTMTTSIQSPNITTTLLLPNITIITASSIHS